MNKNQEEKKLTKTDIKKLLLAMKDDIQKSIKFAGDRKLRMEELLQRPSTKHLKAEKQARLARRLIAATQQVEEQVAKLEKVEAELRNV